MEYYLPDRIDTEKETTSIRTRRIVSRAIFSRFIIMALALFAQIALLLWILIVVDNIYFIIPGVVFFVAGFFVLIQLINSTRDSAFKIMWILMVTLLPGIGAFLYIYTMSNPGARRLRKRLGSEILLSERYMIPNPDLLQEMRECAPEAAHIAYYVEKNGHTMPSKNTRTRYYNSGEACFKDFLASLESAKQFIFLEFFIIGDGIMWQAVREILERKAKEGVEVRLIYDGIGCFTRLPYGFDKDLCKYGIETRIFNPVVPLFSTYQNHRDHRKIIVVDGLIAYTGGINLADEYINERHPYGYWKDAVLALEGDAVRSFTLMFLQTWNSLMKKSPHENYLRYLNAVPQSAGGYVIPLADNPMDRETVIETVYLDILNRADSYCHIMTPYLVIDNKMLYALTSAAKRGVDVSILLPHIPDKKAVFSVARSFYKDLVEAGVHIYEYKPGFVHAKCFVSDDRKAVVGTTNMDFRSLYLHFECAAYLFNTDTVIDVERDFQAAKREANEITMRNCEEFPLLQKICGKILRIFGPLM